MKKLYSLILALILLTSLISVYAVEDWPPANSFTATPLDERGVAILSIYVADNIGPNPGIIDVSITENDNLVAHKDCGGEISCQLFYTAIHTDGGTYTYKAYVTSMETNKEYLVPQQYTFTFPLPYGVSLTADPAGQSVYKEIEAKYIITLTNIGENTDSYTISLTNDDDADIAELDTYTIIDLASGNSVDINFVEITLIVQDSDPEDYEVIINAVSQADSLRTASIRITTTVDPVYGDLSGNIKDSVNKIYNALVNLLQDSAISDSLNTNTQPYGQYSFLDLLTGSYTIEVFKLGFKDYSQEIEVTTISGGEDINIILTTADFSGTISGTILDGSDGVTVIQNAEITITKSDTSEAVQIVYSDPNGNYIINGLPPTLGTFTYSLDATVPLDTGTIIYTQQFGLSGINLNSGQTLLNQDIYLL